MYKKCYFFLLFIFSSSTWSSDILFNQAISSYPYNSHEVKFKTSHQFEFQNDKVFLAPMFSQVGQSLDNSYLRFSFSKAYWTHHFSFNFNEDAGRFDISIGKMTHGFGPAEFFSPSNPLVHFHPSSKSFFYEDEGPPLIKSDVMFSSAFMVELLYRPLSNHLKTSTDDYLRDHRYYESWQLRTEYTFQNAVDYLGLVFSKTEENSIHLGAYFKKDVLVDGLSVYADSRLSFAPTPFILLENHYYGNTYYQWGKNSDVTSSWKKFINVGFRYEGRMDYRCEYIFNENGLDQRAISDELYLRQEGYGRELLTKNYLYQSLRIQDFMIPNKMNLYVRSLTSFFDQSTSLSTALEYFYSNKTVLYFEGESFLGKSNSEFSANGRWKITLGPKISF